MEINQNNPPEEIKHDQIAAYHDDIRQIELEGYELGVKKARNALFWTAGLLLIWQIIAAVRAEGEFVLEPFLFLAPFIIGFVILGIWTKRKPHTAIIIGLCLFIAHWVLVIVTNFMYVDDISIAQAFLGGIVVRIIILINLIRPLKDAKQLQIAKEEKRL
ncbi:hypothetical protein [Ferruginibacter sp. SUN106]|uniref:hypothetical protein n=1 Tax=Ferruginibacter sp. SUN106 TaxID=2978348 RepID=UPI003D360FA8